VTARKSARRAIPLAILLLTAASLAIGFAVNAGVGQGLDRGLLGDLALRKGQDSNWLITLFGWISWASDSAQRTAMIALVSGFLLWRRRPFAALIMLVVPTLNGMSNSLLKEGFGRVRPDLTPHLDSVASLAYPSGHASNAMAFFLLAALLLSKGNRWRVAAVAIALTIGVSRLALGVHWPSDVLGGWLLGTAFALGGWAIVRRNEARA
jgi:undecaprenyl-diphosphatase